LLKTRSLEWPVVSVGSLSAGGAGKTPVVIALAMLLESEGWCLDVLTRGYGRKGRNVERVRTDGENPAWWYGDEPVLIAERAGVPVWVGADRFEAGQLAEAARGGTGHCVHLLDDGFQHRCLARTIDVVLVTEEDFYDELLPGGRLREPLNALARADIVVLREEERERIESEVRRLIYPGEAIWTVRREIRFAKGLNAVLRPVAFCGIARPQSFWEMLDDAGCAPAARLAFADHHYYEAADMQRLVQLAADSGANGFVTTEKDAVKLPPALLDLLNTVGPVNVAVLEASFADPERVAADVEALLK
jgi:tetraacyldisaccharide 4'-kinase